MYMLIVHDLRTSNFTKAQHHTKNVLKKYPAPKRIVGRPEQG